MICWDRVNELRGEVGSEDFLEVVDIFLEEVDEVIERLRSATDRASLESELHFLKGSSLNLGFKALGQLCSHGEKLARNNDLDALDTSEIFRTYEQSMAEFLAGSMQRNFAA